MFSDIQIQKSVLAELSWEPSVEAAHIGVTADAGVVTLTGHVESFSEKYAAENAARRVKGVKVVIEKIEVLLPFGRERGDEEIAVAAIDSLASDVSIHDDSIKVKVEKGWITLTGQVEWNFQKEAADQDVRRLHGVVGVSNLTTIKPRVDTINIGKDIMRALHRSWFFDAKTISVDAQGGTVRLTGTVDTPHERQLAESTAWAASGTTAVENDIQINWHSASFIGMVN